MRNLHTIILCATGILCTTSVHSQSFNKSYAVLIAVNDYQHPDKWPHLDYPEKDARAFGDFLAGQGFVVKAFYGPTAKKQPILSYMTDTLAPDLGQNDRVLVFFAGHGHTGMLGGKKRGYIVPYDGDSSSSLISMDELQDESSNLGNAKHQLFLVDSCFGGLLARPRDSIVDPKVPHYIEDISQRVARQVLTAGGENDVVLDNGPNGHSVFMDALLEALKDGKADIHGYGYITFSDLVAYVVPRASNRYQTPAPGYLPGHQLGEFWFRNPKGAKHAVESIPVPAVAKGRSDEAGRTPEQYVATGDARWFAGDYDGAAEQYRLAIELRPDYAKAHSDLGLTLGSKGDLDGDIREQYEAIRLKSDSPEAHYELGVAFGRKGDWDGEIREQQEAIRLKPDFPEAHYALGVRFGRKGDWDGEIREQQKAIRLRQDFPEAHYELGFAFGGKGDWDGALREEQTAIRLKPEFPEAHYELGIAFGGKGDWNGQIREEQTAIRLKPEFPEAHYELGIAFGWKGDWDGALQEQQAAIGLKSDFPEAHYALGSCFGRKGDWDSEMREQQKAIRLKPEFPEAHYELGIAFGGKGDWDAEIREEQAAIGLKPDFSEAHSALGYAFGWKGDWDGDIQEQQAALRLKPDYAFAHNALGEALEHKGLYSEAQHEYAKAVALAPTIRAYRDNLVRMERRLNL